MDDNSTPALYEPLLETVATWAVEYKAAQSVIFTQQSGNEVRVIGSKQWSLGSVGEAINDARAFPWFKSIRVHVIPPDPDGVFCDLFAAAGLFTDEAPKYEHSMTVTVTRELFPTLRIDPNANGDLIEALKGYRLALKSDDSLAETAESPQHYYFVRALELFACWHRRMGGRKGRDTNAARIYREKRRMAAHG